MQFFSSKVQARRLALVLALVLGMICPGPGWSATVELTVVGTGDSQSVLRELAKAYERLHPGVQVSIPDSIGSSGGIRAVTSGKHVLGRTARAMSPQEQALGLTSLVFGLSPVVFVVNRSVSGVENLTASDAVAIFRGELSTWTTLGGPERKIYLVNREEGDSSRQVLNSSIPGFAAIDKPSGPVFFSTPEAFSAIAEHADTIGYGPLAMLHPETMRALNYNDTAPTAENVAKGIYPLSTPLGLVWKGDLPARYRSFVDFLFTAEARGILLANGVQPAEEK